MFSLPIANTSLTTASVRYRRQHNNLTGASSGVRCSRDVGRSITYSVPSLETVNVTGTGSSAGREMALGEKLRFVAFEGDGLVYKESFVVRGSQVGASKAATIETIASLLQVILLCLNLQKL